MVRNGEADPMHFCFERFECGDDANIADGASFWYVLESDGFDGFGAIGSQSMEFVTPSFLPMVGVGTFE